MKKQKQRCRTGLRTKLRKHPFKLPLWLYIHNEWTNNSEIVDTHCSPDLEYTSVKCRPFFLPRELTVVIIAA